MILNSRLWLDLIILRVFSNGNNSMKKTSLLRGEAAAPKQLKPFKTQVMQSTSQCIDNLAQISVQKERHISLYLITVWLTVIINTQRDILRPSLELWAYSHRGAPRLSCSYLDCDPQINHHPGRHHSPALAPRQQSPSRTLWEALYQLPEELKRIPTIQSGLSCVAYPSYPVKCFSITSSLRSLCF